jgi:hypothetical protein
MKFISNHEIFSRINVRPYVEADREVVSTIISSQKSMFGTSIENQSAQYIKTTIDSTEPGLLVVGEIDGVVEGTMRIFFWRGLPFWSVGSNFTLNRPGLDYIRHRALSLMMYQACMSEAELHKLYDGYIAIVDTGNKFNKRRNLHDQLLPITDRYVVNDVEIIPPKSFSKFHMFNKLLGNLAGKQERTIVVRHNSLKSEFRL